MSHLLLRGIKRLEKEEEDEEDEEEDIAVVSAFTCNAHAAKFFSKFGRFFSFHCFLDSS